MIAAGIAAVIVVALAAPATAESATQDEVRTLAAEAQTDPAALEQLRSIDEVDGRPVDLEAALDGATGEDLERRLAALGETSVPSDGVDAADDRAEARDILDGRRYNPVETPKPFRGPLRWIGDRLEPIFDPIGRFFGWVADTPLALLAIGAAVVALGVVLSSRLAARRTRAERSRTGEVRLAPADDPALLERLADEAEAAGDHRLAYRLRFRAGVLRLAALGTVPYRPSMTTLTLAGLVRSTRFDHLADEFDEVAYGERSVSTEALDAARLEWTRVLEEARQA